MKHLIETIDSSSLTRVDYDRIILDSSTSDVIVRGGVNANGYPYVDLGLPSGLKWATMNVGAESETEYGDYFMWGSTTPNTAVECTWANYKYCNGTSKTLTKYNTKSSYGTVDNKITLDLEDDAARANMGGDWRMPTQNEIQELIDNTDHAWVTNYNGTGRKGRKFTSKTDTSKYIFFPAAGNSQGNVGYVAYVRSSSLYTLFPNNAYYADFGSDSCSMTGNNRCNGFPVRGVL